MQHPIPYTVTFICVFIYASDTSSCLSLCRCALFSHLSSLCPCVWFSEPIPPCSLLHSEVNMKSSRADAEMLLVQGSAFTRDRWLKCHTLGEIGEFQWGGWQTRTAPRSARCFPLLFTAPLHSCLGVSLRVNAWWWCRWGNRTAWMGHMHSSNMLANCAKKLSPLSPLIPLSRGQGVGVVASQRRWQRQQWSLLIWIVS